jgi:hypothetical protein
MLVSQHLANARQLRYRRKLGQNDIPLPAGKRGTADVRDPIALADWWGPRQTRQMASEGAA